MMNAWPIVPLSKIAKPNSRFVPVIAGESYRTIGVKWWGEGAYERETIDGSRTAAKTLSIVREGDLIINKIWVRHGSTAIATKAVDGCAASGEFPTFELDQNQIIPRWIHWQTKTPDFWSKCDALSRGTSGKNRIKPELFLTIEIPLPSLDEQRRIVARIETLAAKIEEARGLRQRSMEEAEALMGASLSQLTQDLLNTHPPRSLDTLTTFIGDMNHEMPSAVEGGIPFISPKDFSPKNTIDFEHAKRISTEDFERLARKCCPQNGDILMARYGTIGAARFVETEREFLASYSIAVIRPNVEFVERKFLYWMIVSPHTQGQAIEGIRGSGMADLGLKTIREFAIPMLDIAEQRRIVAYLDGLQAKVDALKQLQSQTRAEIDALLPSVLDRAFKGEL